MLRLRTAPGPPAENPESARLTPRLGDPLHGLDTADGHHDVPPPGLLPHLAQLPLQERGVEVDYQVAAPAETSTPNWHRATNRSQKSADGRKATEAARLKRKKLL